MKKLGVSLVLFSMTLCLAGCPPFTTREEIRQQEDEKQLKDQVSTIQKTHADSEQKYGDIQNDIRVIAGRVDSVEHNQDVSSREMRSEIENLKKQVIAENEKIKLLEQHVDSTEVKLTNAIQAIGTGGSQASSVSGSRSEKLSPLEEADQHFKNKEFKKAIVNYQAYLEKHEKGVKAAEATYKIGVCFSELGMKKNAKEFYVATIENFSGTTFAKKAKIRLAQTGR